MSSPASSGSRRTPWLASYRELEEAGLVETRGRNGTFVVGTPTEARQAAARLTRDFVTELRELGITPGEMQAMLRLELSGDDRAR